MITICNLIKLHPSSAMDPKNGVRNFTICLGNLGSPLFYPQISNMSLFLFTFFFFFFPCFQTFRRFGLERPRPPLRRLPVRDPDWPVALSRQLPCAVYPPAIATTTATFSDILPTLHDHEKLFQQGDIRTLSMASTHGVPGMEVYFGKTIRSLIWISSNFTDSSAGHQCITQYHRA